MNNLYFSSDTISRILGTGLSNQKHQFATQYYIAIVCRLQSVLNKYWPLMIVYGDQKQKKKWSTDAWLCWNISQIWL